MDGIFSRMENEKAKMMLLIVNLLKLGIVILVLEIKV